MYDKEKLIRTVMEVEGSHWVGFVIDEYSFSFVNRAKEYSLSFEYVGEKEVDGILYCGVELVSGAKRMYYIENGKNMILQSVIDEGKEKIMLIEVVERKYRMQEKIPIEKIKIFFEIFE